MFLLCSIIPATALSSGLNSWMLGSSTISDHFIIPGKASLDLSRNSVFHRVLCSFCLSRAGLWLTYMNKKLLHNKRHIQDFSFEPFDKWMCQWSCTWSRQGYCSGLSCPWRDLQTQARPWSSVESFLKTWAHQVLEVSGEIQRRDTTAWWCWRHLLHQRVCRSRWTICFEGKLKEHCKRHKW